MATPIGIAVAARQAASGYALRALPQRRTYTTSGGINRPIWPAIFIRADLLMERAVARSRPASIPSIPRSGTSRWDGWTLPQCWESRPIRSTDDRWSRPRQGL